MNKTKKRTSLFIALVCVFVLVLSLGIATACNGNTDVTNKDNTMGGAWYYGAVVPSLELGQIGDYYLNTKTLSSYKKTASGWSAMSMEESGEWLYGNEAPAAEVGAENDFYLNTKTGDLYHKSANGWGEPILKLFGRDGVIWFSGQVAPDESEDLTLKDAIEGDFYLDYSTFEVYQLTQDGEWTLLGSIKGDKGEDGKDGENGKDAEDPVQFFNGKGEPEDNEELLSGAKEGDLYIGTFDGMDGNGAGSRLYRYIGGKWIVLMESIKADQVDIDSMAQLISFRESVAQGKDYEGMEVHLKTDLDFAASEAASIAAYAATADSWTPIGTADNPFKGTFDGEGHTIYNFTAASTDDVKSVGFFGYVEGATIEHCILRAPRWKRNMKTPLRRSSWDRRRDI